jgi:enoyl-CoA hydratase
MSPRFLEGLERLLAEIGDARAAIITGQERFFSGGLDLPTLVELDRPAFRGFMEVFERVMLKCFLLPVPVVAAINGHAVAGGCVLSLMADVRIAAEKEGMRIGLNEAQLGLGLPSVVIEPLRAQVPAASLARIALAGELFDAGAALAVGLVHEVVPEGALSARALEKAKQLAALPPAGMREIKASLREPVAALTRARGREEAERWLDTWFAPETQRVLRATVAKLKSKS